MLILWYSYYIHFSWSKKVNKIRQNSLPLNGRIQQTGGSLIIKNANRDDSGTYTCLVNNSVGNEKVETTLVVTGKLNHFHTYKRSVQKLALYLFFFPPKTMLQPHKYWSTCFVLVLMLVGPPHDMPHPDQWQCVVDEGQTCEEMQNRYSGWDLNRQCSSKSLKCITYWQKHYVEF